jgi:hypothetical protein
MNPQYQNQTPSPAPGNVVPPAPQPQAAPMPAAPVAGVPTPPPIGTTPFVAPFVQAQQPQAAAPPVLTAPAGAAPQPQVAGQVAAPVKGGPKPKASPNSTQNTLQIAEIRDGIVIMNDGSFRSVVMVKSINFDLMSAQEQEAVEYSYQGFLNSLYFPIQIFIRSQKVDLQPYRSEERRVGKECRRLCRSRWSPYH